MVGTVFTIARPAEVVHCMETVDRGRDGICCWYQAVTVSLVSSQGDRIISHVFVVRSLVVVSQAGASHTASHTAWLV